MWVSLVTTLVWLALLLIGHFMLGWVTVDIHWDVIGHALTHLHVTVTN